MALSPTLPVKWSIVLVVLGAGIPSCQAVPAGHLPVWVTPVAVVAALLLVALAILTYCCLKRRGCVCCSETDYNVEGTYERGNPLRVSVVTRRARRKRDRKRKPTQQEDRELSPVENMPDLVQGPPTRAQHPPRTATRAPIYRPHRQDSSAPLVSPSVGTPSLDTPTDSTTPFLPSTGSSRIILEELDIPPRAIRRLHCNEEQGAKFSSV